MTKLQTMDDNLVNLTIDGIDVEVPQGTLVVDAAKQVHVDIPVFCYHPKLEPVGMCRMCLVEIGLPMRDRATGELLLNDDGSPKLNFGRGLQTGCTVRVSEGMVVRTTTEPVAEAREDVIAFLLSSHPLDCPICDKGGECPLQNLTMDYGPGKSQMDYTLKMHNKKHVPLGDLIFLDRERCIQCARCIRFQEELVDDPVIQFHNRGRALEIVTMSEPGFDSYWSGNTTDICPVGALTTSDFRFGARPWELTTVPSLSPHSPAGANIAMSTRREAKSGGRSVIKRIVPRQNEWVNEIWISDRDRFVHHFAEAPDRLQKPLIRKNGQLVEVSWDEALDLAAEKLQEHSTAVAGLSGDRLSNEDLYAFQHLFRRGLGSNNVDLANRRLAGGDVAAQVGLASGSNLQDLGTGDAILVVASDLHEEEPIWWLRVKQASERGAALIILNLRSTRLDKYADFVFHYAPGAAIATVRKLINAAKVETGTAVDQLTSAAEALIKANNLVAFYGYEGLTYAETDTLAKLLANLLLLKNEEQAHAGQVNSGLIPVWPHNNTQGAWDMGVHPVFGPGYQPVESPGMTASAIYEAVQTGSLKALYVMGADPVGDGLLSNRGQLDCLIVQELFLTETAKLADIVLPAQSWAEREGTFTSGERRVQRYYRAVPPLGECRADWQITAQIGERLDMGKPAFAASLLFRDLAKVVPQYKGMDYRSLAKVEEQWPVVGGDDLYFGGTSYKNEVGLGQQWAVTAESEEVGLFEVSEGDTAVTAKPSLVRIPALYTPGTLISKTALLADRLAAPTIHLHADDAENMNVRDGEERTILVDGRQISVQVNINGHTPAGLVLLSGVPYISGFTEFSLIDS